MLGGRFHPKIRALRFIQKSERSVFPKNLGARYRPKIWALGFTPKSGRFVLAVARCDKPGYYERRPPLIYDVTSMDLLLRCPKGGLLLMPLRLR